jgi:lipid A disaccharide synthetase
VALPKLACVAGEPSGDLLAAPVLSALHQIPDMSGLEIYGIGGPRMQAEGLRSDWPMETLSVRGYVEAIKQLPAILKLRGELLASLLGDDRPDVFLGVDAPDFNLGVELALREAGIPTLHLVSPSIWAWRAGRIHKIKQAVERMLCIFPFETEIYERAGVAATYVGHPLASDIPQEPNMQGARVKLVNLLNLRSDVLDGIVIAVLPGSRASEIELIANRMVIINKGRTIIQGSVSELLNGQELIVSFKVDDIEKAKQVVLKNNISLPEESLGGNNLLLQISEEKISVINKELCENNIKVFSIEPKRKLEDYFLKLINH